MAKGAYVVGSIVPEYEQLFVSFEKLKKCDEAGGGSAGCDG